LGLVHGRLPGRRGTTANEPRRGPGEEDGLRPARLSWVRSGPLDEGYCPTPSRVSSRSWNSTRKGGGPGRGRRGSCPCRRNPGTGGAPPPVAHPRPDLKPARGPRNPGRGPSFTGERSRGSAGRSGAFASGCSNPREGRCSNTVALPTAARILYRGSIAERWSFPYADPKESSYRQETPSTSAEYGRGAMLANNLGAGGATAWGTIRYFDTHLADNQGRVVTIKNAVCPARGRRRASSGSIPTGATTSRRARRSRRLAVSMIANVGNYDYGFYWYFYQDGPRSRWRSSSRGNRETRWP